MHSSTNSQPDRTLSQFARTQLGIRAKQRRKALGLVPHQLANALNTDLATLRVWEECLINQPKIDIEKRWEELLEVPKGWLRNMSITAKPVRGAAVLDLTEAKSASDEIQLIANWLARSQHHTRTSDKECLTTIEQRNAGILSHRYGVNGKGHCTLDYIGDHYGLTRERVRQIIEKMLKRVKDIEVATPCILAVRNTIQKFLPSEIHTLDAQVRDELGSELSLYDLNRFCNEVLGIPMIKVTKSGGGVSKGSKIICFAFSGDADNQDKTLTEIRQSAISMIRNIGAAHLLSICGDVSQKLNEGLTPSVALRYCKAIDNFEWIAEEYGWFWFGPNSPKKTRLLLAVKKMLVVAEQRLDISTLYDGFLRTRRHLSQPSEKKHILVEPPSEIIAEILRKTSSLRTIQHDDFELIEPISATDILSELDLLILNEMRKSGEVIARKKLLKLEHNGSKVNPITLQRTLDKSPIFSKLRRGVYAIRGRDFTSHALEKALIEKGERDAS